MILWKYHAHAETVSHRYTISETVLWTSTSTSTSATVELGKSQLDCDDYDDGDDDCLLVKKKKRQIGERRDEAINDRLASLPGGASRYG